MNLKAILSIDAVFTLSTPVALAQSLERSGTNFGELGI